MKKFKISFWDFINGSLRAQITFPRVQVTFSKGKVTSPMPKVTLQSLKMCLQRLQLTIWSLRWTHSRSIITIKRPQVTLLRAKNTRVTLWWLHELHGRSLRASGRSFLATGRGDNENVSQKMSDTEMALDVNVSAIHVHNENVSFYVSFLLSFWSLVTLVTCQRISLSKMSLAKMSFAKMSFAGMSLTKMSSTKMSLTKMSPAIWSSFIRMSHCFGFSAKWSLITKKSKEMDKITICDHGQGVLSATISFAKLFLSKMFPCFGHRRHWSLIF